MSKFYTFCIYLLLALIGSSIYSQVQNKADSLFKLLDKEEQDTTKVLLYKELTKLYLRSDIDSALFFATTGLYLAEKQGFDKGIGKMYQYLGHVMVVKDSLETAKKYYLNALESYKKTNDLVSQCGVFLVLGNIFFVQDNYPPALNYYISGQKIADSFDLVTVLPDFYNNIGALYDLLEDFQLSLKNYKNALKLNELNKDTEKLITTLDNMSRIYLVLNDYDQAKLYNERAFQLANKTSVHEAILVDVYQVRGDIELELKNYKTALKNYKKALDIINKMGPGYLGPSSVNFAKCLTYIGISYFELGEINLARDNLIKGYDVAKGAGLLGTQRDAAFYLSKVYDSIGNLKNENKYLKILKSLSDSISNENTIKKITQLKMQFEFDKKIKEKEIEELRLKEAQKRKELFYLIIIGGSFLSIISLLLLFNTQRLKRKNLFLEKESLKTDLEYKNKELTTNVMYLFKKNEFITDISEKLKKGILSFIPENRTFVEKIINDLESSSSQDTWKEFEVRFQKVHSNFYEKLNEKFPDLSPNELKLCAFLRLNMSTKDIASITYQSIGSIRMARYRLRKKLGLGDHANLINFLSQE